MSYQKQNFANGEVLTASQLNHIEDGIVAAEQTGGGNATLTIGTVTSGTTASASISGGKLNLVLPKGDTGPQGESGQSLFYPTRAAMIADSQLTEGCICLTLGYYKAQDGGGAEYLCQYLWSVAAYPWAVDLGERDAVEYRYALRPDGTPEVDEDGEYKLLTDADGKPIPVYEDDGVTPKKRHLYAMIQNQVVNYRMFGAVQTDTTPLPDLRPYVRSETVPTAETSGAVRADGQYGVAVRADATLTTVPATTAQLDRMTEAYAPLTPALLPYGVKKALTSAAGAAGWSAQEKAAALLQLGADDRFYSKAEADRKFGTAYTLPCATAAVLGGVKAGRGVTVGADGTLEVTRENLNAVLGFSLTEKLERLERMMNMDGKLVYTGAGVAGKSATSLTVPGTVNYIVVRMVAPTAENDANPVAAAADYGSTRIVRGGTAVAMVGGTSSDLSNGVKCSGAAPVRISFADNGVLSIGVVRTDTSLNFEYPFNVEGYQYV